VVVLLHEYKHAEASKRKSMHAQPENVQDDGKNDWSFSSMEEIEA